MRILFVSSGNALYGISPIIKDQSESLKDKDIEVIFFSIKGKGIQSYLKHILLLRKFRRQHIFDLYHAHYSLSGITATLAGCKPIVVSLMGSDLFENKLLRFIIRILARSFWEKVIVKSQKMARKLEPIKVEVLPNGVNLTIFKPMHLPDSDFNFEQCKQKRIIFVADPSRPEKNYKLARQAVDLLIDENIHLITVYNKQQHELVEFYNTADVLLMTSFWEGSPNVIKEAMACNCPIVTTDVGDVRWVIGETPGCFISTFEPEDIAEKLRQALIFGKRTRGRERIMNLKLNSQNTANKLILIYKSIISNN